MEKCKDCELFEYTTTDGLRKRYSKAPSDCDGLCYFRSPPWEPHPTNSEWDTADCPHYLEFLRQDTEEYDMQMRDILTLEEGLPSEKMRVEDESAIAFVGKPLKNLTRED
nr:MAG TPA: hypothetical protein [Caudoviricetes sp.]